MENEDDKNNPQPPSLLQQLEALGHVSDAPAGKTCLEKETLAKIYPHWGTRLMPRSPRPVTFRHLSRQSLLPLVP